MKIAAAYIRASTLKQEDSPDTQRATISDWCERHGYTVPADLWFVDVGVSGGKPIQDRQEGKKMLAMTGAKPPPFQTVIIVRLDRAFRDLGDQATTISYLKKRGVELVATEQDITADTASQMFLLQILGGVAEFERKITGERITEHNLRRFERLVNPSGHPPFGLKLGETSDSPFEIDHDKLPTAIRVFEIYAETCGNMLKTARKLHKEGYLGPHGGLWGSIQVLRVVSRPAYRRQIQWQGKRLYAPDLIPETIPPELLARVDAIIASKYGHWHVDVKSGLHSQLSSGNTYARLITCGVCGQRVTLKTFSKGRHSYVCYSRISRIGRDVTPCDNKHIHAKTFSWLVGQYIKREIERFYPKIGQSSVDTYKPRRTVKSPNRRVLELQTRRERALQLYLRGREGGGISVDEWTKISTDIDAEIAELRKVQDSAVALPDSRLISDLMDRWDALWLDGINSPALREMLTTMLLIPPGGIVIKRERIPDPFNRLTKARATYSRWTLTIESPTLGGLLEPYVWDGVSMRG